MSDDFAIAVCYSRLSRIVKSEDLINAAKRGLDALYELLHRYPVGQALMRDDLDHPILFEKKLYRHLLEEANFIASLCGHDIAGIIRLFMDRYRAFNISVILSGRIRNLEWENLLNMIITGSNEETSYLRKLYNSSWREFKILVESYLPFAIVEKALNISRKYKTLSLIEAVLFKLTVERWFDALNSLKGRGSDEVLAAASLYVNFLNLKALLTARAFKVDPKILILNMVSRGEIYRQLRKNRIAPESLRRIMPGKLAECLGEHYIKAYDCVSETGWELIKTAVKRITWDSKSAFIPLAYVWLKEFELRDVVKIYNLVRTRRSQAVPPAP